MKLLSVPIALVLGLLLVLPASAASTPFAGEWIGNDPAPPDGDGSTVHLYITAGDDQVKITFTDDFTGFKGLGFLITCLVVAVPAGLAASAYALWRDRRSWLARAAMAVNALLALGALFMMSELTF